jgi:hypothetical protein
MTSAYSSPRIGSVRFDSVRKHDGSVSRPRPRSLSRHLLFNTNTRVVLYCSSVVLHVINIHFPLLVSCSNSLHIQRTHHLRRIHHSSLHVNNF